MTMVIRMPNQTRSKPAALIGGSRIGTVIRMIDTGGRKNPSTTTSSRMVASSSHFVRCSDTIHAAAAWRYRFETRRARTTRAGGGLDSALLSTESYTLRQRFAALPRVLPFVILLTGVMVALYGGFATPSETAGLGAVLALILIAVIYDTWRPRQLDPILVNTIRESTMLMMIIGMSLLYSYVMSYLHISQSAAEWIVSMHFSRWVLLAAILVLVVVLGFFLPPVSIILMTAPIILPPLKAAGFDLIWFGVLMTIVMETGLIHPPVGLNLFVIKNIAPDIALADIIWGVLPFVGLMLLAVLMICVAPGIATALPDAVMGLATAR